MLSFSAPSPALRQRLASAPSLQNIGGFADSRKGAELSHGLGTRERIARPPSLSLVWEVRDFSPAAFRAQSCHLLPVPCARAPPRPIEVRGPHSPQVSGLRILGRKQLHKEGHRGSCARPSVGRIAELSSSFHISSHPPSHPSSTLACLLQAAHTPVPLSWKEMEMS